MKLALAMIVKGSDDEAVTLRKCLKSVAPYVDGIFITSTFKPGEKHNKEIDYIASEFGATVSYFEWVNDFAKARNFNFSQVPKEYEYIMWTDADDVWQNASQIRSVLETHSTVDAFAFWYYYHVDSENNPTLIHKKTQVVRNDGCVEWVGRVHEDFKESRALNMQFVEKILRVHIATEEHVKESMKRNLEISKEDVLERPDDPKAFFNLARSYSGTGDLVSARNTYKKFLQTSQSDDEKYLALQSLSSIEKVLENREEAIRCLQIAIGMFPNIPDAINQLGYLYFDYGLLDEAERYLLIALPIKPPYHKMLVFNPRDYDYTPLMTLAKIYFGKSRPDYALPLLKNCLKFYPHDESVKNLITEMESELATLEKVIEAVKRLDASSDNEFIRREIEAMPPEMQAHPAVSRLRNQRFMKTESSGKDVAYYCGQTSFDWNPDLFKTKGFGGSEEAVINLAREWAKLGYNVTVYNSCGLSSMVRDGVTYKPFWQYNPNDKYDYTVLWRSPRLAEHDMNTGKLYVDMHDVIAPGEFNEKRLKKIDKIFVKTQAHRDLFPLVPDEKFEIIPNGLDFDLFAQEMKRDPYLMVNTSSPDRSMDVLPELFKRVKRIVPKARLKWAYGWDNWDYTFKNDKAKMEWKDKIVKDMEEAGIEAVGRLPQSECAKLYLEGQVLAYPTEFYEIDCISVKKAQACGCIPVTTDFAALAESNKFGTQIHSKKTIQTWNKPYQFSFGMEDEHAKASWVQATVKFLGEKPETRDMKKWARRFAWPKVAKEWISVF